MEIRKKLLYQFVATVALILLVSSLAIYFSFSGSRRADFYERLGSKAKMVAQMLIEIDEIDAELLKKIESNNPLSLQNEKIIIYDYQNNIIYSTDYGNSLNFPETLINEVRLNGETRMRDGEYEIIGQFYTGKYDRFVVFAAATDIFGLKKLIRLRIILLIVFLLSLIIVFFSGRLFAARALNPISDIMEEVDAIGVSSLNSRLSEGNGKDELARLAHTFNNMLGRLETAFKTQKSFIANASHELRTPLTVITGQLDVVLMNARENEEYRKAIQSVLEDIKNLNTISDRLLLLAQASSEFPDTAFSLVRIDDLIWQVRKDLMKRNPGYHISVDFSEAIENENSLTVSGNEMLIKTALGNLIDNACKYSEDHTSRIHIHFQQGSLVLKFSDNGMGIPESELGHIFQPFYRSANAIGFRGHGIGLSLVEKIVNLHGGKITVSSKVSVGSVFTVFLPVCL